MHRYIAYFAYGWLTFVGTMHFSIDVVAQYLRRVRAPGAETSLYYALNSSFALGQAVLGALGLWLVWRAPEIVREPPVVTISALAAVAWFVIALLFMEYWQPRVSVAVFGAALLASALTAKR